MISLDENMIGIASDSVIISGLKVCMGVVCRVSNNWLAGAHFTPGLSKTTIETLLAKLATLIAEKGEVTSLTIVTKLQHWTNDRSGLTSGDTMGRFMRRNLNFRDTVHFVDLANAPASYDVELKNGFVPSLGWRATPDPNPVVAKPNANVFRIRKTVDPIAARQGRVVRIETVDVCDGSISTAVHSVPVNVAGFANIANPLINTIRLPVIGTRN